MPRLVCLYARTALCAVLAAASAMAADPDLLILD